MALKTEFLGLAVMAEVPLVVVDVQRGGPATGLPTKVEQGDLLASLFGQPGDAPKVVMRTVEPRRVLPLHGDGAQARRELPHAGLRALGRQPRDGPGLLPAPERERGVALAARRPVALEGGRARLRLGPGDGLSRRPIPGQPGGNFVLTGLAHDEQSHIAYESAINQRP